MASRAGPKSPGLRKKPKSSSNFYVLALIVLGLAAIIVPTAVVVYRQSSKDGVTKAASSEFETGFDAVSSLSSDHTPSKETNTMTPEKRYSYDLTQVPKDEQGLESWYSGGVSYWDQQEPNYSGVLGGYTQLHAPDVNDSRELIEEFMGRRLAEAKARGERLSVYEGGAGVGRVTKDLLLQYFADVDVSEPSEPLLTALRQQLLPGQRRQVAGVPPGHYVRSAFHRPLQEEEFEGRKYDVIWLQWCLLYLVDDDLVAVLNRAQGALKPGGYIIVKDNIADRNVVIDNEDNSVIRSDDVMLQLMQRANLRVLKNTLQKNFPDDLYKIRMYVLQP